MAKRAKPATANATATAATEPWWRSSWALLALLALVGAWVAVFAGLFLGRSQYFVQHDLLRANLMPALSFAEVRPWT